jgi:hypothetical protein
MTYGLQLSGPSVAWSHSAGRPESMWRNVSGVRSSTGIA